MKRSLSRGFTLLEMVISLAFVAVLSITLVASVRATATESAANAADSELLRTLGKVHSELERDLRRAQLASINLSGAVDAEGGRPVIEFSYAEGIGDDGALIATTTVRYEASNGAFRRVDLTANESRAVAGFPSVIAGSPPLSFFVDSANRTVRFKARASRSGDSAAFADQLRSREGAIFISN